MERIVFHTINVTSKQKGKEEGRKKKKGMTIGKRVQTCPSVPIMRSRILRSRITSPALTQTID